MSIPSRFAVGVTALCVVALGVPSAAAPLPGAITEFTIPTATSRPYGIAGGPDGNIWFAENAGNKIGRITPAGAITEFPVPTAASAPAGIAAGPDGNMWFTENAGNKIGRITPAGAITEFPVPTAASGPTGIAAGPDGNMWFTEYYGGKIGRITPAGAVTEFPIPTGSSGPVRIAAGPDGNLWFTENSGNKIGRLTPAGTFTEFPVPTPGSYLEGIAAGPDGNLWFAAPNANKIGRISPAGEITEFPVPTAAAGMFEIAAGPDGNMWFTEYTANKIAWITPAGAVTEFPVPSALSTNFTIGAGPDGNMWFAQWGTNKIARITSGVSPSDRRPALAGTGQVGLPLVCAADVWGARSTVIVGWQRDGAAIGGQSGLSYTPTVADLGAKITCTSRARLPAMLTDLTSTSNAVPVIPQPSVGSTATLAAVWAPGSKTVRAGKRLKVQYAVTTAAALKAQLKGKKTLAKPTQAKAGTNTLKWKLPKSLKAGKYRLRLLHEGTVLATTKVRVKR